MGNLSVDQWSRTRLRRRVSALRLLRSQAQFRRSWNEPPNSSRFPGRQPEQRWSVLRPAQASNPQPFPVFPDFLEEVQSSAPSISKSTAPLAFLEGAEALGLAQFPPVYSTILSLVRALPLGGLAKDPICPNGQCRITEANLKKAYTRSLLTAYLDGMLQSVAIPELLASKLRLVSGTLLQISGFQGQALDRSLAGLVVARRQL
ncbi:UNVERIFIED_CONTAM: hypothetical protein FKN15_038933 [Acipenser sinensis]